MSLEESLNKIDAQRKANIESDRLKKEKARLEQEEKDNIVQKQADALYNAMQNAVEKINKQSRDVKFEATSVLNSVKVCLGDVKVFSMIPRNSTVALVKLPKKEEFQIKFSDIEEHTETWVVQVYQFMSDKIEKR
ncbi:hypothetical protein [Grimontia marina]|uniref:Uncharacterized protein n=1 Tax=Grimontia marina TaxID=646534 RepID=A0A128EZH7_9GAMM|nr:hypothetical protein [Grimontia marina]CZF79441.1 hypothetical protein GMA8713_00974 [Grimontia marina]